jgi:PIN domain nuclease of toxin-antitoxin system
MRVVLDTHAYLWQVDASPSLSQVARNVIADDTNTVYLGIASLWEIAIKMSIDKLQPAYTMLELAITIPATYAFEPLLITPQHLDTLSRLPLHHRDPFDRLIVAQSLVEDLIILSNDAALDRYEVQRLW